MTQILTMDEAATRLRKKRRWLRDWLRAHKADAQGIPYFRKAGRTILFTEGDLTRILEAMLCRSNSSPRAKAKARTGQCGARTSGSMWMRAAELTGNPSLAPSATNESGQSSAASGRRKPNLSLVPTPARS
jgi:hypothetical protein